MPGVAGILPIHIFGSPAPIAAVEEIAAGRGLGLVEDAAQALGTVTADGRKVGAAATPAPSPSTPTSR